jgi:hypothetical protein
LGDGRRRHHPSAQKPHQECLCEMFGDLPHQCLSPLTVHTVPPLALIRLITWRLQMLVLSELALEIKSNPSRLRQTSRAKKLELHSEKVSVCSQRPACSSFSRCLVDLGAEPPSRDISSLSRILLSFLLRNFTGFLSASEEGIPVSNPARMQYVFSAAVSRE